MLYGDYILNSHALAIILPYLLLWSFVHQSAIEPVFAKGTKTRECFIFFYFKDGTELMQIQFRRSKISFHDNSEAFATVSLFS